MDKKIKHPAEFTQVNASLEVVVLEIDTSNRKISLGHKQLEANPWDEYAKQFVVGNDYEATAKKSFDKGLLVSLSEEVEAFLPKSHAEKIDGSLIAEGEILVFRVIEFSSENKKLLYHIPLPIRKLLKSKEEKIQIKKRKS